jgi:hypothetical protein
MDQALHGFAQAAQALAPELGLGLGQDDAQVCAMRRPQQNLASVCHNVRLALPDRGAQTETRVAQSFHPFHHGDMPFDADDDCTRWQINDTYFTA